MPTTRTTKAPVEKSEAPKTIRKKVTKTSPITDDNVVETEVSSPKRVQGASQHKTTLRIKLVSFNSVLLHETVRKFVASLKRVWSKYSGPIPLPTDIEKFTVNKSPHVYKKAQEQFEIKKHAVLIVLKDPTSEVIQDISSIELPHGVDVKIKVSS